MATNLNISASVVLKTAPGKVLKIAGVSGVPAGTINDAAATGGTAYVCALPAIGTIVAPDWPTFVGIAVNITAGAVSVMWE